MTKCNQCDVVDLGVNIVIKDEEEYELCPNCDAENSVEEIDELEWAEGILEDEADKQLDLFKDEEWD